MEAFEAILENKRFQDFNPITCGCAQCAPGQKVDISVREFLLIHYVVSGSGKLMLNNNCYSVKANQIFIIPPYTPNVYQASLDNPWNYIWIGLTGELTKHFFRTPPVMDFYSNIFFELLNIKDMPSMREEYLAEKAFRLYRALFSKNNGIDYIAAVQNYIDNNYMIPDISIQKIATSLNLNRSYLSRIFKQSTGITIQNYLINTRISNAVTFLKRGDSVQDVARQVGYADVFNFSKAFKAHTSIAPSKFSKIFSCGDDKRYL